MPEQRGGGLLKGGQGSPWEKAVFGFSLEVGAGVWRKKNSKCRGLGPPDGLGTVQWKCSVDVLWGGHEDIRSKRLGL